MKNRAFTLIETLVALGIFLVTAVAVLSLSSSKKKLASNYLERERSAMLSTLIYSAAPKKGFQNRYIYDLLKNDFILEKDLRSALRVRANFKTKLDTQIAKSELTQTSLQIFSLECMIEGYKNIIYDIQR